MLGMELFFAQVAHAATAETKRIELGRPLTDEEDGEIWAEVFAGVKRARAVRTPA